MDEQIWRDSWNTDSVKSHYHKHVATVIITIIQQQCHRHLLQALVIHAAVDEQIWRDNWNTDSEKSHDHKHVATVRIAIMQQRCHRPRYDHGHLVMMTMVDNNCHNDHWYRHRLYHHIQYRLYHHCHNCCLIAYRYTNRYNHHPHCYHHYRHVIVMSLSLSSTNTIVIIITGSRPKTRKEFPRTQQRLIIADKQLEDR